jgi:hypothetical protein
MTKRFIICIALSSLLVAACGGDGEDLAQSSIATPTTGGDEEFFLPDGTVVVRAGDPTFQAPLTLPEGPTSFTVNNEGRFAHQMLLVKIDDEDPPLFEIAELPPKRILETVEQIGIIERVKSRELSTERIEAELVPSRYGLLCLFKTSTGDTHAALGMNTEIIVTG